MVASVRIVLIILGTVLFLVLLAFIGVRQIPAASLLGKAQLPKQISIIQPDGNAFSGKAQVTIDSNDIEFAFELVWRWCPGGLNSALRAQFFQWCIELNNEHLQASSEIKLLNANQVFGIELTQGQLSLMDFTIDHPLYSNLTLDGDAQLNLLQINFNSSELHRIHQLQLSSREFRVKLFDVEIDKGELQLNKAVNQSIIGNFAGRAVDADLISFENGDLHFDVKVNAPTGPVYAILSLYLDNNEEYHYRGRWY